MKDKKNFDTDNMRIVKILVNYGFCLVGKGISCLLFHNIYKYQQFPRAQGVMKMKCKVVATGSNLGRWTLIVIRDFAWY